jgi:hypothetical protein
LSTKISLIYQQISANHDFKNKIKKIWGRPAKNWGVWEELDTEQTVVNPKVKFIQCDKPIFEKVFLWFLGQPVVWSQPNISQIEAWSSPIYTWYQEFELDFCLNLFLNFKQKWQKLKN